MFSAFSVPKIPVPTMFRTFGDSGRAGADRCNLAGCENSLPSPLALEAISHPDPGWLVDHWDAQDETLRRQLGQLHDVPDAQVFITSGALGAVAYAFQVFTRSGTHVGLMRPEWPGFQYFTHQRQLRLSTLDRLDFPFHFGIDELGKFVRDNGIEFLILSNPSAATGHLWETDEISALLTACPETLFVIDEADAIYPNLSSAHLAARYNNGVWLGSFSKFYGLSGMRIGYLITPAAWAKDFENTISPAEVTPASIAGARKALVDLTYQAATQATTAKNLAALEAAVTATPFHLVPGSRCFAAFLWTDPSVQDPHDFLADRGIDIVPGSEFGPCRGGRVNLSDPAKIDTLVAALSGMDAGRATPAIST